MFVDNVSVSSGKVYVSKEQIISAFEYLEVYADMVGTSGLQVNEPYYLYNVDKGNCCFQLVDQYGAVQNILFGGFRLHRKISGNALYLTNVKEKSFQIKMYKDTGAVTLSSYNSSVPNLPIAKFCHLENVVAKWYTPVFDFGTNESSKTLLKMTISTEPEVNGRISFGYETKSVDKVLEAKGVNVFSFENLSFENFSFDTGFASSYSVKINERNFNFIIFRFVSDNEYNCAINSFSVIYKINKQNRGVK